MQIFVHSHSFTCEFWNIWNPKKLSSVNADNSTFTLFAPSAQLLNADISAFSAFTHYEFILIKLLYT